MDVDLVTGYQTENPQQELYDHLATRLGPLAKPHIPRPRPGEDCNSDAHAGRRCARGSGHRHAVAHARKDRGILAGRGLRAGGTGCGLPEADLAYTLLSDKNFDNVSSMFSEQKLGERLQTRVSKTDGLAVVERRLVSGVLLPCRLRA